MSERWGDSRRDRDALDRWITRDDRDYDDDCDDDDAGYAHSDPQSESDAPMSNIRSIIFGVTDAEEQVRRLEALEASKARHPARARNLDHTTGVLGPVLNTWREMYAEWEAGNLPSPSISDLIYVAEEAWRCSFPVGIATRLYDAQCDGVELPELLIHLYDSARRRDDHGA